jgi:hypothetical protein
MQINPYWVFVAPLKVGLDDKKVPIVGARPPFFEPPHVLVLLQIEAALRALRLPE